MCQAGDFEYWRLGGAPSVSVEMNREPSWTIRIHEGSGGYGTPAVCVMTAEPDATRVWVCHLKAISGRMPPGSREKLAKAVRDLGFSRVRWERLSRGGMSSFEFDL